MRWQCSLFSIAFIAFFGMSFLSEELFKLEDGPREASGSFASLRARPGAELFKGRYLLSTNGTDHAPSLALSGVARITVGWQRTSIVALQVLSIAVTLVGAEGHLEELELSLGLPSGGRGSGGGGPGSNNIQIVMRGVELMAVGKVTATGFAGGGSQLLAALRFRTQWPQGPGGLAAARGDAAAAAAAVNAGEAAADVAADLFGTAGGPLPCRLDATLRPSPAAPDGGTGGASGGAGLVAVAGDQEQAPDAGDGSAPAPLPFERAQRLEGDFVSADCGFALHLSTELIDVQDIGRKVAHYALWANVLTIIQIRCFVSQMRYTEDGPSAARLSMVSIAAQALLDAYDSFLHLSLTASSQYMVNSFALISMFKFILFAMLEVRYVLTIWRCRHQDVFAAGWEEVRRHLSRVYSYFYGALLGGLLIIFHAYEHLDLIALLFQAHWVPQILHDLRSGSKASLQPRFLVGISVTRCLAMCYLWGCPSGVFSGDLYPALPGSPSPRLCIAAVVLQVLQVAILASQQAFGPRWFVPWLCLPHVYNYSRVGVEASTFGSDDCVICMGELGDADLAQQQPVITPCEHRFHRVCLERWMDIKLECPTCRAEVPPMC